MSASIDDYRPEAWTTSANGALKVAIVGQNAVQFFPLYTYPIFGDSEQIYGYRDLTIYLAFDSITFKPFFNFKFSAKLEDADRIQDKILEFLPQNDIIIKDEVQWVDSFKEEQGSYKLPGEKFKVGEYTIKDESFAVYKCSLDDSNILKLHKRVQIFSLLFIEAANYIDSSDPNWSIFWCFNKRTRQCIGYCTSYIHWKYLGGNQFDRTEKETDLKYSTKISQFLVFPNYQGKGHGSQMYACICQHWFEDPQIIEITVEDPNESFDDLRDINDLKKLLSSGLLDVGFDAKWQDFVPDSWIDELRTSTKLNRRQLSRLIEIVMLKQNSEMFEMQTKRRLYLKNYDTLCNMESQSEIKEAIEKAFEVVSEDYDRILHKGRFL